MPHGPGRRKLAIRNADQGSRLSVRLVCAGNPIIRPLCVAANPETCHPVV